MMLSSQQMATALDEASSRAMHAQFKRTGFGSSSSLEVYNAGLRGLAEAIVRDLAEDMDFWNSIHDSDNQADSNWIRERYANG